MQDIKNFSVLKQLPLGSVTAGGWLREQLTRNKQGIGGHLDELEPNMIATPYTTKVTEPRWGEDRKAGWGAEISGNYWTGLVELAFTLDDDELKAKAERWVNEVLSYQKPDGYLGTYTESDNLYDDYNAWGSHCGMSALLSYYEATGRLDVLDAVHRCFLWFCEHWAGDKKTRYGGVSITESMMRCYHHTGDRRLLQFCEDYYAFLRDNDLFDLSLEAMNSADLHYNSNHGSGYANHIGQPAEVFTGNGDERYLNASLNAYAKSRSRMVHVTGGITCESEYLAPLGPHVETEYCGFSMYLKSLAELGRITGQTTYHDDIERVAFNGAQGARKKDEKAIAYLTSPNQAYATADSSYADHIHQVYAPCVPVSCCPVMSVRLLPEFIMSMVHTEANAQPGAGNLYFSSYAPAQVRYGNLRIDVVTDYPFGDIVRLVLSLDQPSGRTFFLRIPGWCADATLEVNGKRQPVECRPESYVALDRRWENGDEIVLRLPRKVRVSMLNDRDRSRLYPLAFEYGALVFALPIPERWQAWQGRPYTPLPEGWHWYNVTPSFTESSLDVYDNMGMRKYLIPYNIAVDERIQPEDIEVIAGEVRGYPWENPPLKLRLNAFKAPYSYPPYPSKTFEPYCQDGKAYVTDDLSVELIPYGCTNLRITYIPRADLDRRGSTSGQTGPESAASTQDG